MILIIDTLSRKCDLEKHRRETLSRKHLLKIPYRESYREKLISRKNLSRKLYHYRDTLSRKFVEKKLTFIENFYREIEDFDK